MGLSLEPQWGMVFQTIPEASPLSCTMRTGSLSWGQSNQGVALTTHPLLVPGLGIGRDVCFPSVPAWHVMGQLNLTDILPSRHVSSGKESCLLV